MKKKFVLIFALLLSGCASLSKWQYIGIYEFQYQKAGISRTDDTFGGIVKAMARRLDVECSFTTGDPKGWGQAFLYRKKGDLRPWPARIVVSESSATDFSISIIKQDKDEPDWLKAIRKDVEASLKEAGCQKWDFYIQRGSMFN